MPDYSEYSQYKQGLFESFRNKQTSYCSGKEDFYCELQFLSASKILK